MHINGAGHQSSGASIEPGRIAIRQTRRQLEIVRATMIAQPSPEVAARIAGEPKMRCSPPRFVRRKSSQTLP
jgi:hypothetical protein